MIELNKQAKPFNPAEDVVGSDLFWMFKRCQLIGWHYFSTEVPKEKGKQVIALMPVSNYKKIDKQMYKDGWVGTGGLGNANLYVCHKTDPPAQIVLTSSYETYQLWTTTAEVCRLMGFRYPESKKFVSYLHQIIIDGKKVKLDKDGKILGVMHMPEVPVIEDVDGWEPPPEPGDWPDHANAVPVGVQGGMAQMNFNAVPAIQMPVQGNAEATIGQLLGGWINNNGG